MQRIQSQVAALTLALGGMTLLSACSEDIDRTQPDKVLKCTFTVGGCDDPSTEPAEYYFARTVIDVPSTDPATFVGNMSDVERVIFDITDITYDPDADLPGGTGPVPVSHWNPQKIYASDNTIHFIRDSGGTAQFDFDDFEFAGAWPKDWP